MPAGNVSTSVAQSQQSALFSIAWRPLFSETQVQVQVAQWILALLCFGYFGDEYAAAAADGGGDVFCSYCRAAAATATQMTMDWYFLTMFSDFVGLLTD